MAEKSGFFNALKNESGNYDRKYGAKDFTSLFAAFIRDGVRRSGDDDLKVTANGGLNLKINVGYAVCGGNWYHNDAEFVDFSVPTPPSGDMARIDRIVLRRDPSISIRDVHLAYKTGVEAVSPVAPSLTQDKDGIYEIAIADIRVPAAAASITALNITDQRPNKELCGWITTPVGYDDYFESLDSEFEGWFLQVRDKMATTTTIREYHQRVTTQMETSVITITIAQYDPTGLDRVLVFVNGLQAVEGIDYTLADKVITFTTPKVAGTDIDITVKKSVDATGLGSVINAVEELQEEMSTIKNIGEYIYICNGIDDNVKLSDIAKAFFANGAENSQLTINVYGTFGATAPDSGTGASTSRYRWFNLGSESASSTKRVIFDFLNCSSINLTGQAGQYYICFYGANCTIKNATIIARQRNTEGSVVVFASPTGTGFVVEGCKIDVSSYYGSYIAGQGTFRDCSGTVTNSRDNSYCFALEAGLLRVFGGTFTAYTGLSSMVAAVFGENAAGNGTIIAYGVNCPTIAKASHYQTGAARFTSKTHYGLLNGTITTLSVATAVGGGISVTNTIAMNYPSVVY